MFYTICGVAKHIVNSLGNSVDSATDSYSDVKIGSLVHVEISFCKFFNTQARSNLNRRKKFIIEH